MKQGIGVRLWLLRLRFQFVAVHQKEVQPAVPIKVEPSRPAAHDFRQKITSRNGVCVKREIDPLLGGDLGKSWRKFRNRRVAPREHRVQVLTNFLGRCRA